MRASMRLALAQFALVSLALTSAAQGYTFKVIHDFCSKRGCRDGNAPASGLSLDAQGNLYGATRLDEQSQESATIFEMSPAANKTGWKFKTIYSSSNFLGPNGNLIFDSAGNIYGTAQLGGSNDYGEVFELLPRGTHGKKILKSLYNYGFQDSLGYYPLGLTYQGQENNAPYDGVSTLFGVNTAGGAKNSGAIFALTPSNGSWTESSLYDFCSQTNCSDGSGPRGLNIDQNGALFGATAYGGKNNFGTVFSLAQQSGVWSEEVLHDFCGSDKCTDGAYPFAPFTKTTSGDLLGLTGGGGDGRKHCCGTIFKLTPEGENSPFSVVASFCMKRDCSDGAQPQAPILLDATGNLFGITLTGGPHRVGDDLGGGTVFMMKGSTRVSLHNFCAEQNCADGDNPVALAMDASGNFYGLTERGGKYGAGTVFELTP